MNQAICTRNEPSIRGRLASARKIFPSMVHDAVGLVGVIVWCWAWLRWIGSV